MTSSFDGRPIGEHAYIRRRGRMTKAQSRAFENLTASYSLEVSELDALIDSCPNRLGIEIGFGMGHALLDWAQAQPDLHILGIELYQPGVGALTDGLHQRGLTNVSILERPAQVVLAALPPGCIAEIRIFFPDPWPKKRHHKRKLIQPDFVEELARVLQPDGVVRLATDWTPYAQWMRECFAGCEGLTSEQDHVRSAQETVPDDIDRETTNFERRGERLGHDIHDLSYRKVLR